MPRLLRRLIPLCLVFACSASLVDAQITVLNGSPSAANPFVSTVGTGITIDTATSIVGGASAARTTVPANAAYLPTGVALNPSIGFTIQFWYWRASGTTGNPDYLFGDNTMVAPAAAGFNGGAFRCFAGGAAGVGNLLLRGVANQIVTATLPLNAAATWVHLAFRYDPVTTNLTLLVNGVVTVTAPQVTVPFNWTGTNLTFVGYNGSTAPPMAPFNIDDLRIYNFARSDADILADFMVSPTGLGPSGLPNIPDGAYFDFEGAVEPHVASVGTNGDPISTRTRIVTGGSVLEWAGNSPNQPGNIATGVLNLSGPSFGQAATPVYPNAFRNAPAMPVTYTTPGIPGLELGHGISSPVNPFAIAWPDGLGLGGIPGLFLFAVPGPYAYQVSPNQGFIIPPGLFQTGDRIDIQFLAPDPAYPLGVGTSNRATFIYSDCAGQNSGPHAHIEARGSGSIQVTGFWEVWNTGTVDITRVVIDLTTATGGAAGFDPNSFLNSGGMLSLGTSYRFNSEIYTGLQSQPPGYMGLNNAVFGTLAGFRTIQFDYNSFTACTDIFSFDSDIVTAAGIGTLTGASAIGATVTVTFANSTTLMGTLVADPADVNAAILNL